LLVPDRNAVPAGSFLLFFMRLHAFRTILDPRVGENWPFCDRFVIGDTTQEPGLECSMS